MIEEATGKPVKPANFAAGIAQIEAKKTKLLDRMKNDFDETLKDHLAAVNKDLATARERLAQFGSQKRGLQREMSF